MNPYKVLNVRRNASAASIKAAYRKAAKTVHPDAGGSTEAFEQLRAAYDALRDPEARAYYDSTGRVKGGEADNAIAQALQLLSQTLDQVLQANPDFTVVDLVQLAQNVISQSITERSKQREQIAATRPQYREMLGRFTSDDDSPNLMARIIEGKLEGLDSAERRLDEQDKIARNALEILNQHSYRFDPRYDVVTTVTRVSASRISSTGW